MLLELNQMEDLEKDIKVVYHYLKNLKTNMIIWL
jgi:hypothetical protein